MPVREFIGETIKILLTDAHEVLLERVAFLRNSTGPNDAEATNRETIGLLVGRTSTGTETELHSKAGLPDRKENVRCSQ